MKRIAKNFVIAKLKFFSGAILKKYHPQIVAITGSAGKTTIKDAIFLVLSSTFNVRKNEMNYNNEIGVPLTIIGKISPGKSIVGWFFVLLKATWLTVFTDKNYPDILVLEMGADHPGDIEYLVKFVKPHVSVISSVSETHLEFFETLEGVAQEKSKLVSCLTERDTAFLNYDDRFVNDMKKNTKAHVETFGMNQGADILASHVRVVFEGLRGLQCSISNQGESIDIFVKDVIAKHFVYFLLAAFAVGTKFGLTFPEIKETLKGFMPPPGRMRLLEGIKRTFIIDDTYNASPFATEAALKALSEVSLPSEVILPSKGEVRPAPKKFAVLGDMLELGSITERAHREIGKSVFMYHIDYLITAGEAARDYARGAKLAGMDEDHIFSFHDANTAGKFLQQRIKKGDIILIKGSQGARMERVVQEIMAEPLKASEILVRQEKTWR